MASTTTNYGWVVPTSSDLVKNGATAISTVGSSVDTSLWNSGFGQAGKNKLINGDFSVNQRAFTSTTTTGAFGFDRWLLTTTDGTSTYSAQTFTTGAAPVAGYESTNFARLVSTGQTLNTAFTTINQKIEDVRTFAGQTVTVSFWAKASTGTPNVAVSLWQDFGTGGSPSAATQKGYKVAITSSWARYSATFAVHSLSGKTIGTANNSNTRVFLITSAGSTRDAYTGALGIQSITVDFWGAQIEYGSYATPFQTASGGSPQSELAMCQRYYWRANADSVADRLGIGQNSSTTAAGALIQFPVQMRTSPSALETTGTASDYSVIELGIAAVTCTAVPVFGTSTTWNATFDLTVASGLTQYRTSFCRAASATAYLGWSAEL
jgi:hypothetical protein